MSMLHSSFLRKPHEHTVQYVDFYRPMSMMQQKKTSDTLKFFEEKNREMKELGPAMKEFDPANPLQ